ncbi:hypothetical protein BDN71DRAFT_1506130 [Pleurotus eryngii]|uniref:Uncharacterized protein n=1 Tax=Pleurotus eryngii TaxID=5323 RepID=A0A9P5ZWY4_PLEER|nr:hypothetical protein BDN71DRAFT_1506130 [Pleurotus eryngii]
MIDWLSYHTGEESREELLEAFWSKDTLKVGLKLEQLSSQTLVDGGPAGRPDFKLPVPIASSLRHFSGLLVPHGQVLESCHPSQLRSPTRPKAFSRYHPYPCYTEGVSCDPLMQTIDERDELPAYQDARGQPAPNQPRNGTEHGRRQGLRP